MLGEHYRLCFTCVRSEYPADNPECLVCMGTDGKPNWVSREAVKKTVSSSGNPYWERICILAEEQRAKGLETYGQGLENNPAGIVERINHLQEELIDGLMYCEWIKEKYLEGGWNDGDKANY